MFPLTNVIYRFIYKRFSGKRNSFSSILILLLIVVGVVDTKKSDLMTSHKHTIRGIFFLTYARAHTHAPKVTKACLPYPVNLSTIS